MASETVNITLSERLDFWLCFFLESSDHLLYDKPPPAPPPLTIVQDDETLDTDNNILVSPYPLVKEVHLYFCKAPGAYLTRDAGRYVSIILLTLIFLVGLFGVITNVLNVILLRKSFPGRGPVSFKESLVVLAVIECVLCLGTIGFSYYTILILENIRRGQITMHLFHTCNLIFTLTRTMSVYTTLLITMERFLVVAFPIKSKVWLYDQPWKSRTALAMVLLFSLLINLPWMFKSTIVPNEYENQHQMTEKSSVQPESLVTFPFNDNEETSTLTEITSKELMDFPWLIKRNDFAKRFNRGLQETLLALDFVVPFPFLLVINALLYKSIYTWNKERAALNSRQKRDINAAKMFSVVVIILLSCHSVSCAVFFTSRVQYVIYRELLLLQSLAVVFGASANFLVYYFFGTSFQQEFWALLKMISGDRVEWINRHYQKHRKDSGMTSLVSQPN